MKIFTYPYQYNVYIAAKKALYSDASLVEQLKESIEGRDQRNLTRLIITNLDKDWCDVSQDFEKLYRETFASFLEKVRIDLMLYFYLSKLNFGSH